MMVKNILAGSVKRLNVVPNSALIAMLTLSACAGPIRIESKGSNVSQSELAFETENDPVLNIVSQDVVQIFSGHGWHLETGARYHIQTTLSIHPGDMALSVIDHDANGMGPNLRDVSSGAPPIWSCHVIEADIKMIMLDSKTGEIVGQSYASQKRCGKPDESVLHRLARISAEHLLLRITS